MTATEKWATATRTFATHVATGFLKITHNGFALLGLAMAFAVITITARPDLRQAGEAQLVEWLQNRQEALLGQTDEPLEPSDRTLAMNPQELPREQARVAFWRSWPSNPASIRLRKARWGRKV